MWINEMKLMKDNNKEANSTWMGNEILQHLGRTQPEMMMNWRDRQGSLPLAATLCIPPSRSMNRGEGMEVKHIISHVGWIFMNRDW